jgi:hypothetical protein
MITLDPEVVADVGSSRGAGRGCTGSAAAWRILCTPRQRMRPCRGGESAAVDYGCIHTTHRLQATADGVDHSSAPPLMFLYAGGIGGGVEGRRWAWEELLHTERILVRRQKHKQGARFHIRQYWCLS